MDWLKFHLFLLIWVFSVSEAFEGSTALQPTECVPGQSIPPPDDCNTCVCFDGRIHCTHLLCSSYTNTMPDFECVYDTDIPPPDECNVCLCHEGRIACTNLICIPEKSCIDGERYPAPDECNECSCVRGHVICTNEKCQQKPLKIECVEGQVIPTQKECFQCNCVQGQIKCANTCIAKPNTRINQECEIGQPIPRPDKCNACICHKGEKLCSDSPCYKATNKHDTECNVSPLIPVDFCNECECINGRWTCFNTVCIRGATCVENEEIPGPDECNVCQCHEGHIICTNYDCKLFGTHGLFGKTDKSMSELEVPEYCEEDEYIPPPPPPNDCNKCACVDHRVFCTMTLCVDTVGDTTEIFNRQNDKLDIDKKILMDPFLELYNKKYDKAPTKLVHTHAYNGFQQEIKVHSNHLNQDVNELIMALATSLDNPTLAYISEKIKSPSNGNIQFASKGEGNMDVPDIQLSHSLSSFITSGSSSNETILVIPAETETSSTPTYQEQHIITPYNGESINLTFVQKNQDYISSNPPTIISTIEQYNNYHNPPEVGQPDFYTIDPTSSIRNTDLTDDFILPVLPINPKSNNLNDATESYTPHTREDEQIEPNSSSISPQLNQTENTTPVYTNFTAFSPINNPGQHQSPSDVESQYIPTQSNPNTTIYHDNQNETLPNFNNQGSPNNLFPTVFNQSAPPFGNQNMLPDSNNKPLHHHQFNSNPISYNNYQDNPTQAVFNPYEVKPVSISDDKGYQNNPQHTRFEPNPAIYNNHPFNSHPPEFSPVQSQYNPYSLTPYNTHEPFNQPQIGLQPNQEKPRLVPDNRNSPYDMPQSKFEPYPTTNNPHQFKVPQSKYEQDRNNNKPNYLEMTNGQGYNLPQNSYNKPENNDDNKLHNANQLTPAQSGFLPGQNEQNPFIQHYNPSYSQFKPHSPSLYYSDQHRDQPITQPITHGEQFDDAQRIIKPNQDKSISTLENHYNPPNESHPQYKTQTSVTYVTHFNETDQNSGQEPALTYPYDTVSKSNISPDQDKKPRLITYITQINSTKYEYPFDNQHNQLDPIMFKVHQYPNPPNVQFNSKENENLYPTQTGLQPNADNYETLQLAYPEITQINQYNEFQPLYPTQYEKNKIPITSSIPQPGISPTTISHPPRFAPNYHDRDEAYMKNDHPGNPLYSQYNPPQFSTSVQNDKNKGPLNKIPNTDNVSQPNNNISSLFKTKYYPDIPEAMGALIDDTSINPRFSQHYPPYSTSLHSDKNKSPLNKNPNTNNEYQPKRNTSPLFTTKYYPDIPGTLGALIDLSGTSRFDQFKPHPVSTPLHSDKNKGPLNKNPNTNNVSKPNNNTSSLFTTKYYPDIPGTLGALIDLPGTSRFDQFKPHPVSTPLHSDKNKGPLYKNPNTNNVSKPNNNTSSLFTTKYYPDIPGTLGAVIDLPGTSRFDQFKPHPVSTPLHSDKNKGPLNKNPNTNNVSKPNNNTSSLFTTKYYPDMPGTLGALIDLPGTSRFDQFKPHPVSTPLHSDKIKGPLNKNPNTNSESQPKRNTSPLFTTKYYPDIPGTLGALIDLPGTSRFDQFKPHPVSTPLHSDKIKGPLNKNPNTNSESQPKHNTSPLFTTKYYPDIPGAMGALIDDASVNPRFSQYHPPPFSTSIRHDDDKLQINKNPNTNIVSQPGLSPITNNNTSPLFPTKYYPRVPGAMGALIDDRPENPQFGQYYPPQFSTSVQNEENKGLLNKNPNTNHDSQPKNNKSPLFTTKYYPDIPGTLGALIDDRPRNQQFSQNYPPPFSTSIRNDDDKLPINKNPNTNIVSQPGLSPITNNNTSPLFPTKYYPHVPGAMGALIDDRPRNPPFSQNYPPQLPTSELLHGNKEPLNKFPITVNGSNNDTDLGSFPNHNNSTPITLIPIGDPSTDQSYPVDDRGSSGGFQYVSHSAEDPIAFESPTNKPEPGVFDDRGAHDGFQYISHSDENTENPKNGQMKPLSLLSLSELDSNLLKGYHYMPWLLPKKDANNSSNEDANSPNSKPLSIDDLINQFDNSPNQSPSTSPTVSKDPDSNKYRPRFKNVKDLDNLINNPLYKVAKKLIDSPPSDDSEYPMSDLDPLDLLPLLFPEISTLPFYKPSLEKNKFKSSPSEKEMPFLPVGDKERPKNNSPLKLEQPTNKIKKNESPYNNVKNKLYIKSKSPLQNPKSGQPNKAYNSLTTSWGPKNLNNFETTTYPMTTQYPITESPKVVSKVAEEKQYKPPPVRYPDVHIILHQRNEGEEISTPPYLETDILGQLNDVNEELGGPFTPKILHSRFRHRPKDQKEECGEGTQWLSNCHTCSCFAGKAMCSKIPDCTLRHFGEPMICKPYSQFKMGDCYSCECSGDGVAECDATDCKTELNKETEPNKDLDEFQLPVYNEFYDSKKTKELIQYYAFFKKLPKDTSSIKYPTCDPGTTWVSSCHQCECKESFTHECTKIEDCELDRESYGKPSRCKPNSKFYPKMNSMPCVECSCDDEGKPFCPLTDHK